MWGGVAGFVTGASIVTSVSGDAFLSTPAGWTGGVVGAIAGGSLAVVSWWGPIGIGAGSVGWIVGAGLASLVGIGPGALLIAAGVAGGVLAVVVAVVLETPRPLIVVLSAVGGGSAMGAGIALLLAWAPLDSLDGHMLGAVLDGGAAAMVVTATLMAVAAAFQLTTTRDLDDEVQLELARRRG